MELVKTGWIEGVRIEWNKDSMGRLRQDVMDNIDRME